MARSPDSSVRGRGSAQSSTRSPTHARCSPVFSGSTFSRDTDLEPDAWLYLFLASYAAAAITSLVKFRTLPAYHLYLSKAAALCAGIFFVWLYAKGFSRPFFLFAVALGVMANVESLLVTLFLRRFRADISSLFSLRPQSQNDEI